MLSQKRNFVTIPQPLKSDAYFDPTRDQNWARVLEDARAQKLPLID